MKINILAVILTFAFIGCGTDIRLKRICKNNRKEKAKFIIDCAAAANPMSDEEGEDLVQQCNITANDINFIDKKDCNKIYQYCNVDSHERCDPKSSGWTDCDDAPIDSKAYNLCFHHGWKPSKN